MSFDIIGDIHGHGQSLELLLDRLGYEDSSGSYQHPVRKVIFLGDFIDRGSHQRKVVDIARAMIDSGNALAVMGNHELNAIAYHTYDHERGGLSEAALREEQGAASRISRGLRRLTGRVRRCHRLVQDPASLARSWPLPIHPCLLGQS